ncbi:MAG: ATP-binding cassette domain-containing protein [Actinomycetota bacterium]
MTDALTFLLLGLGSGAAYAIAGIGLVQIYRASGVINFAHGGIAFMAAAIYAQLSTDWGWPWVPSFLIALAASVVVGILMQLLVMRPLRHSAVLVRIIATVGVLAIIEQGIPLVFGNITQRTQTVKNFYPSGGIDVLGARLTYDRIIMVIIVILVGLALSAFMRRTTFGLATSAVAEDELVAQTLRVNPDRIALANWALGGGLAGLAGLLTVPWTGLIASTFLLLVVPALATALVGRFDSFALTVIGGLALGSIQAVVFRYQVDLPDGVRAGWNEALPFILMIILLMRRGSAFPERGEVSAALPSVGRRRLRPIPAVLWAIALFVIALLSSDDLADAISSTAGVAMVGLSLVVVTGLAGQISLAQMAMAGLGALFAARLSGEAGWPFLAALGIGVLAGCAAGSLFALPALRTRGPTLAVATVGLGVAVEKTIFTNQRLSGASFSGIPIERPSIFGWDINAIAHPERFAAVSVVFLVALVFIVSNLRAGPVGRRFLAVRSNERAAAALGVSVARVKLVAFTIAAGIAAVGGVFLSFKFENVLLLKFNFFQSLLSVVFTLIGGIGYLLGPVAGAFISPSGIVPFLFNDIETIERWLIIVAGVIVIVQLIAAPDGVVRDVARRFNRSPKTLDFEILSDDGENLAPPATLQVENLSVTYPGGFTAINGLDIEVRPGQIVGLIGPNGAGKTSAIDAISGFIPHAGAVRLDDADVASASPTERALAGLGRTFQTVEPFDDLSVAENLAVAEERLQWSEWLKALVRVPPLRLSAATGRIIDSFELESELPSFPNELPQGRRRLLGVARAMAAGPSVLLLDEPAAGLDSTETGELGAVLRRVATDSQVGMLLVEHDMSIVTSICDHVVALDFGRVIFSGPPDQAMTDERVRAAYLGIAMAEDQAGTVTT